jgi:hypothetical protein
MPSGNRQHGRYGENAALPRRIGVTQQTVRWPANLPYVYAYFLRDSPAFKAAPAAVSPQRGPIVPPIANATRQLRAPPPAAPDAPTDIEQDVVFAGAVQIKLALAPKNWCPDAQRRIAVTRFIGSANQRRARVRSVVSD